MNRLVHVAPGDSSKYVDISPPDIRWLRPLDVSEEEAEVIVAHEAERKERAEFLNSGGR